MTGTGPSDLLVMQQLTSGLVRIFKSWLHKDVKNLRIISIVQLVENVGLTTQSSCSIANGKY